MLNHVFKPLIGAMAAVAVAITGLALASAPADAGGDLDRSASSGVLRVSGRDGMPKNKQIALAKGKSILVEFGVELRDVVVSDPATVDAVVQTSNRVFLIAKKNGQTNAFFFDVHGQQIMTLEISVGADVSVVESLFERLLPGSNIKVEAAGQSYILSGTVRTPTDANRAAEIARQFLGTKLATGGAGGVTTNTNVSTQASSNNSQSGGGLFEGAASTEGAIINLISVEGEEQVMLRVVVAEVQREILKQFGVNLGAAINSGNFATTILTENVLPLTAAAGLGKIPLPGLSTIGNPLDPSVGCPVGALCNFNNSPGGPGIYGNSGVSGSYSTNSSQINHALRALERDGLLKTLAEPNLTAVSGETAKFLAGGEFPILVPAGLGQTSVQFKPYGVGVSFTPVVLSEGRISLKIESEVSELTNEGSVQLSDTLIPALKTRKANSTVELPSGGSIALAGLISDSTRQNIDGFPGLKDVPVLGTLFRSRDFIKKETEMVVIVTPYLVRPTSRQELARPLDGLGAATDARASFMGHINRVYGGERPLPAGDLKGDYGFIVE